MKIENSSNSSKGEIQGNTIIQISPAIKWCFTLHNYNNDDIENLNSSESSKFLIFSKELGKEGKTPHLQGYIEFKKKVRPKGMFNKQIHWEKAKGNKEQNIEYITKENGYYWINGNEIKPLKIITELYDWQREALTLVSSEPNDRVINWFWEDKGNIGKSAFVKLLCVKYNALLLSNKSADMKYGIVKYIEKKKFPPKIIVIDIPRSVDKQFFSYTGVEEIKNGCFFCPKYESEMVVFNSPHMIVFANEEPDTEKMSLDRWNIINII